MQDLEQPNNSTFLVVGRLPICDIIMGSETFLLFADFNFVEHPSVSRYHCILQYGEDKMDKKGKGWFIYDMVGSYKCINFACLGQHPWNKDEQKSSSSKTIY